MFKPLFFLVFLLPLGSAYPYSLINYPDATPEVGQVSDLSDAPTQLLLNHFENGYYLMGVEFNIDGSKSLESLYLESDFDYINEVFYHHTLSKLRLEKQLELVRDESRLKIAAGVLTENSFYQTLLAGEGELQTNWQISSTLWRSTSLTYTKKVVVDYPVHTFTLSLWERVGHSKRVVTADQVTLTRQGPGVKPFILQSSFFGTRSSLTNMPSGQYKVAIDGLSQCRQKVEVHNFYAHETGHSDIELKCHHLYDVQLIYSHQWGTSSLKVTLDYKNIDLPYFEGLQLTDQGNWRDHLFQQYQGKVIDGVKLGEDGNPLLFPYFEKLEGLELLRISDSINPPEASVEGVGIYGNCQLDPATVSKLSASQSFTPMDIRGNHIDGPDLFLSWFFTLTCKDSATEAITTLSPKAEIETLGSNYLITSAALSDPEAFAALKKGEGFKFSRQIDKGDRPTRIEIIATPIGAKSKRK